ncbi:uncharacterized protein LOC100116411 isoform X1 [Nasonia vitripennis]|uniref:Putative odorant binding protein 16 n=1 Tax=Nasonia vitripennis TaxID=7425 RepID=G8B1M1_NASVI|nr:uncharacterized protein LOC100116411 isoform X1 [Nasonia vitripennis]CCD17785.1 putative odorant binding protein 16 [Nasonia vitripennis]
MRVILLSSILLGSIAISRQNPVTYTDKDNNVIIPPCLAETGLNLSVLGVAKIEDVRDSSFYNLKTLTEDKRGCFVACVYKKLGIITEENVLINDRVIPPGVAVPKKKLATAFEDATEACRAQKDLCKLGNCLYEIYFF